MKKVDKHCCYLEIWQFLKANICFNIQFQNCTLFFSNMYYTNIEGETRSRQQIHSKTDAIRYNLGIFTIIFSA